MHHAIEKIINNYKCQSLSDYVNALKEIVQKIALLGLWRSKFFEKAAFYGGTSLRILYGLDRYSEDLDFSLLSTDPKFSLNKYNEAIETELKSFGLDAFIISKEKRIQTNIESTLIKIGAKQQLIKIITPRMFVSSIPQEQKITIKMEVDTRPPLNFEIEQKLLLDPIPFYVNTFQKPDLFATKLHAILCRNWNTRVKGRDWYDFIWYISQQIPLRLVHLETRLIQSGHWTIAKPLNAMNIKQLLYEKLKTIDIEQAKKDVLPFIADKTKIDLWSVDFFQELIDKLVTI